MHKMFLKEVRIVVSDLFVSFIWAIGYAVLQLPNQIASSGLSGAVQVINFLTGLPIGIFTFLLNVPFFILGYVSFGFRYVYRSIRTVITYSIVMDLFFCEPQIVYTEDPFLAAILAGILYGIGSGLLFRLGSSGGGVEILYKVLNKKFPHVSIGQLSLYLNCAVIIIVAIILGGVGSALYGFVTIFVSSKTMDLVIIGPYTGKACVIVTSNPEGILRHIINKLQRTATIIDGTGGYAQTKTKMLFCIVRRQELPALNRIVRNVDPSAFVVVGDVSQILGGGFSPLITGDEDI